MMTQLRQRMLEELQRRNYSAGTIRLYLQHVAAFVQAFAVQTWGGARPLFWSFASNGLWVGINLDQSTGVFSGSAGTTGTFFGTVGVFDETQTSVSQKVTLTVKTCP